jgi:tRNA A-37 threonylcarbamoyl transferase component Bud32
MRQGLRSQVSTEQSPGRVVPPDPAKLAGLFPQIEILELIGHGGMGAVYKARQTKLDRLVALKILTSEAARGPAFAERFTREARALARVNHPNIVAIHDFGDADGLYYFVMEYVDGANLRQVLQAGTLSPHEALAIIPQVCDALQFAHEEGVVHRDIKPENILVDRKGRVKIADFGLAKMIQPAAGAYTLTVPGEVMGTPAYMAPEQIEKPREVDHRADIFSLGVVFYEMLTGELPLGRFAPPSRKVKIDVRLDDVVLRTLEKEPELRYQQASDVKSDVQSLDEDGGKVAATSPGESIGRNFGRSIGETIGGFASECREAVLGAVETARPSPAPGSPAPPAAGPTPPQGTPPPSAAAEPAAAAAATATATGDQTGPRTVDIRRPLGVTLVAIYCFLIAIFGVTLPLAGLFGSHGVWAGSSFFSLPFTSGFFLWPGRMGGMSLILLIWSVLTGFGLLRLRRWARISAIILAIPSLANFPLGTVISILILVYLLKRDVARLFELGEGTVTLSEAEALQMETVMGHRR